MLLNASLLAIVAVHTAENEPSKVGAGRPRDRVKPCEISNLEPDSSRGRGTQSRRASALQARAFTGPTAVPETASMAGPPRTCTATSYDGIEKTKWKRMKFGTNSEIFCLFRRFSDTFYENLETFHHFLRISVKFWQNSIKFSQKNDQIHWPKSEWNEISFHSGQKVWRFFAGILRC